MADYFCDPSATGLNNGTTMTDAWTDPATAFANGRNTDYIWFRRGMNVTKAADVPVKTGNYYNWPRASLSFTATFTNGSTTVTITGGSLTANQYQHAGRRIKLDADGDWYCIFEVTSTTTLILDREYAGTGGTGNATIEEDEHYTQGQAISASFADLKATWNADTDALPIIDFSTNANNFTTSGSPTMFWKGFNIKNGTSGDGSAYLDTTIYVNYKYCIFEQTNNNQPCMWLDSGFFVFLQCLFRGASSGFSSAHSMFPAGSDVVLRFYGVSSGGFFVGYGSFNSFNFEFDCWNNGKEVQNQLQNVNILKQGLSGRNYRTQNTVFGQNESAPVGYSTEFKVENYNTYGVHRKFRNDYTFLNHDVLPASGDPYQRTGGADEIIKLSQGAATSFSNPYGSERTRYAKVFEHLYDVDDTSKTYTYYINSNVALSNADLFYLEAQYIELYDDDSEYVDGIVRSTETISVRSGVSDWSQYLSVTVDPDIASFVKIRLISGYALGSADIIYIDPKADIS